jgi:hypothetical protein
MFICATVSSKKESHSTRTGSTLSEVEYGGEAIKLVDKIKSSAARLELLKDTGIYFHQKKQKKKSGLPVKPLFSKD